VLWVPLHCIGMMVGDAYLALVCLGVAAGMSSMANSLGATALHDIVSGRLRGQATALFFLVINMIGPGVGPTAIALVTDRVFADDAALRYSTLLVALPALSLGAILLWLARRRHLALRNGLETASEQAAVSTSKDSHPQVEMPAASER
jgi:MFS family permease